MLFKNKLSRLKRCSVILISLLLCSFYVTAESAAGSQQRGLHIFYYSWYGNLKVDGQWAHWDHQVLPYGDQPIVGRKGYPGGDDIGANFYPELGTYSANDEAVMDTHLAMMKQAGVSVIILSWWGDSDFGTSSVPIFMDKAAKIGLKVNFHIEPIYHSAAEFLQVVKQLDQRFGQHPALYHYQGKPLYYVYDSYKMPISEWQKVLLPKGELTVRGKTYDANFIGLWVDEGEESFFLNSGMDGFYTYFAVDGFVYGSTTKNWPYLAKWAKQHNKLFIPSVGPGYADDRIRPWNKKNFRAREAGKYYDAMFKKAIAVAPTFIGVTSFNEWHEGTQIEPAIEKQVGDYKYLDYSPLAADYYLKRTHYWSERFQQSLNIRSVKD